jgi:hypothetical protein
MWYVLFALAALAAFRAVNGCADLAWHHEAARALSASSDADYARYRGTGESAEDLQPLTRAELEQEYRVEECGTPARGHGRPARRRRSSPPYY